MIERFLAFLLLFFLSPFILLIWLSILIEGLFDERARGPLLHSEKRFSKGKPFILYKFRTLYPLSASTRSDFEGIATLEKNPKNLTRTGRFLKKYYLDEFPQTINIIRGDMSFVGPRPLAERFYKLHLDNGNIAKKKLRAGWTGLWQSQKGYINTLQDMVRVENEYYNNVKNSNKLQRFLYDFKIILKTFKIIREGMSV